MVVESIGNVVLVELTAKEVKVFIEMDRLTMADFAKYAAELASVMGPALGSEIEVVVRRNGRTHYYGRVER